MHDVAWRGMWICVRSKDAQKQLARTSLSLRGYWYKGQQREKEKKWLYHSVYTYQTVKIAVSQSKPNQNGFWQVQNRSSFRVIIGKQRFY